MLFSFLIPSGGSAPACTLKDGTPVPGYRLCCMRCSFVCHLVEDVVTDDQSVTAIVTSEVGHVSYIGDTGDGFLGCLNTACGDPAGFVYGIYLTVQCWSKLSGGIDNTVNTIGICSASYTVHNYGRYRQLAFVAFTACFTLYQCGQQLRVPRGRGKISITCPKCGHQFIKKS